MSTSFNFLKFASKKLLHYFLIAYGSKNYNTHEPQLKKPVTGMKQRGGEFKMSLSR